MTQLRQVMLDELQRRNYAPITIKRCLEIIDEFAGYFGRKPGEIREILEKGSPFRTTFRVDAKQFRGAQQGRDNAAHC